MQIHAAHVFTPGEYRKIFLANYLCIGFVPGGNVTRCAAHCNNLEAEKQSRETKVNFSDSVLNKHVKFSFEIDSACKVLGGGSSSNQGEVRLWLLEGHLSHSGKMRNMEVEHHIAF